MVTGIISSASRQAWPQLCPGRASRPDVTAMTNLDLKFKADFKLI